MNVISELNNDMQNPNCFDKNKRAWAFYLLLIPRVSKSF